MQCITGAMDSSEVPASGVCGGRQADVPTRSQGGIPVEEREGGQEVPAEEVCPRREVKYTQVLQQGRCMFISL